VQNDMVRITQLHMQGFHCAQILLALGLELQGKENTDLVRAMTGLAGGLGFCGKNCGALTGAVCLLGLFAGRGTLEEREHRELNPMIQEVIDWFETSFGTEFGGIDCQTILQADPWNRLTRCPRLITETYLRTKQILTEHGFLTEGE
jgi:C_GCAxxG_C_C family probable redox protein